MPFADRNTVFRCTPEDALQIGHFVENSDRTMPPLQELSARSVRNIEVGVVSVSVVDLFDRCAHAADMRLDRFGGPRRSRDRNVRLDADGYFKFQSQSPEIRTLHAYPRSMDTR